MLIMSGIIVVTNRFYTPPQSGRSLTLGDILDKPWLQVSALLSPGACLPFNFAQGRGFPLVSFVVADFHRT